MRQRFVTFLVFGVLLIGIGEWDLRSHKIGTLSKLNDFWLEFCAGNAGDRFGHRPDFDYRRKRHTGGLEYLTALLQNVAAAALFHGFDPFSLFDTVQAPAIDLGLNVEQDGLDQRVHSGQGDKVPHGSVGGG